MKQNDLEIIKAMLASKDIPYTEETFNGNICISVERGYSGFIASFTFDNYGTFLNIEAMEEN